MAALPAASLEDKNRSCVLSPLAASAEMRPYHAPHRYVDTLMAVAIDKFVTLRITCKVLKYKDFWLRGQPQNV